MAVGPVEPVDSEVSEDTDDAKEVLEAGGLAAGAGTEIEIGAAALLASCFFPTAGVGAGLAVVLVSGWKVLLLVRVPLSSCFAMRNQRSASSLLPSRLYRRAMALASAAVVAPILATLICACSLALSGGALLSFVESPKSMRAADELDVTTAGARLPSFASPPSSSNWLSRSGSSRSSAVSVMLLSSNSSMRKSAEKSAEG